MTDELENALFAAATKSANYILRRVNLPVCNELASVRSLILVLFTLSGCMPVT